MNPSSMHNRPVLKFPITIFILLMVSLLCWVIFCIGSVGHYTYTTNDIGQLMPEWQFGDVNLFNILAPSFWIVAEILLFLYILIASLNKQTNVGLLVPISLIISALPNFIAVVRNSNLLFAAPNVAAISFLIAVVLIGMKALIIISAFRGFSNKVLVIISMVISLICTAYSFVTNIEDIRMFLEMELYMYALMELIGSIGSFTFYIALLFLGLCNHIPSLMPAAPAATPRPVYAVPRPVYTPQPPVYTPSPVYPPQPPVYTVQPTSPPRPVQPTAVPDERAKALQWLREGLDSGLITAEQYQEKREEILRDQS